MNLKKTVLLVFLVVPIAGWCQLKFRENNRNADSLAALIPFKKGTEKIDVLNLLSNAICRHDIDSSMHLAANALSLSEQLGYKKGTRRRLSEPGKWLVPERQPRAHHLQLPESTADL